jgi:hypothetical protein
LSKRSAKSSNSKDTPRGSGEGSPARVVADLYRAAASQQFAHLEADQTISDEDKLATLYKVFENLVEVINRISSPAPEKAPELWIERDPRRGEGIDTFIRRTYAPYILRGMTMADLSRLDLRAYHAWYQWRKLPSNRGAPTPMPTRVEANSEALAQMGGKVSLAGLAEKMPAAMRELIRLRGTAANRRRRSKAVEPK